MIAPAVLALVALAPAGPLPVPPSPVMPTKTWTAEELTTPIMHFSCDLLSLERETGKLEFVVTGGRAYPEARKDRQFVTGFGRTKQHVEFAADQLALFPAPEASEVAVWPTAGKFFVHLTGATPPAVPYGSKAWRSVVITYNYGMPVAITVNSVPRAQLATGFCSVATQPQTPLTADEAAPEGTT
jgi:hypothetical protein